MRLSRLKLIESLADQFENMCLPAARRDSHFRNGHDISVAHVSIEKALSYYVTKLRGIWGPRPRSVCCLLRCACTEERDCSPAFHSFDQLKRKLQSLNLCQRSSSKPQMGSR